jgi:hypothetical protein
MFASCGNHTSGAASLTSGSTGISRTEVKIQFDTSPNITRRLASGDAAGVDVLITATAGIDQAIKDGKAIAGSRAAIGKVGVGLAIRRGARRPDLV